VKEDPKKVVNSDPKKRPEPKKNFKEPLEVEKAASNKKPPPVSKMLYPRGSQASNAVLTETSAEPGKPLLDQSLLQNPKAKHVNSGGTKTFHKTKSQAVLKTKDLEKEKKAGLPQLSMRPVHQTKALSPEHFKTFGPTPFAILRSLLLKAQQHEAREKKG